MCRRHVGVGTTHLCAVGIVLSGVLERDIRVRAVARAVVRAGGLQGFLAVHMVAWEWPGSPLLKPTVTVYPRIRYEYIIIIIIISSHPHTAI